MGSVVTAEKDDMIYTAELEKFVQAQLPAAEVTHFDNVHELPRDRPHQLADMIVQLCDSLPTHVATKEDHIVRPRVRRGSLGSLGRPHRRQRLCDGLPTRVGMEGCVGQPRMRTRTW